MRALIGAPILAAVLGTAGLLVATQVIGQQGSGIIWLYFVYQAIALLIAASVTLAIFKTSNSLLTMVNCGFCRFDTENALRRQRFKSQLIWLKKESLRRAKRCFVWSLRISKNFFFRGSILARINKLLGAAFQRHPALPVARWCFLPPMPSSTRCVVTM